jgi:hypothetical protein
MPLTGLSIVEVLMARGSRNPADDLVADYLNRLRRMTVGLPAARRTELLAEVADHIDQARAPLPDSDQLQRVADILDSLGAPEQIAWAAYEQAGVSPPSGRSTGQRVYDVVTVVLLMVGGLFPPVIGWVVGVGMLWAGPRWSVRDEALGTLVWPLGPGGILVFAGALSFTVQSTSSLGCSSGAIPVRSSSWPTPVDVQPTGSPSCTTTTEGWSMPPAVGVSLFIGVIVTGIAVGFYLAARARRHDHLLRAMAHSRG